MGVKIEKKGGGKLRKMVSTKLKVTFCCLSTSNCHIRKTVYIPSPLHETRVNDIKTLIAKEHNIPACVQKIKWAGFPMRDDSYLESLKENDELEVVYHSEGDCLKVEQAVKWFKDCVTNLKMSGIPINDKYVMDKYPHFEMKQQKKQFRRLCSRLFYPWNNPNTYTNKLHFLSLGGLDALIELYNLLQQNDWVDTPSTLKYTEFGLLHTLWAFGETHPIQRLAVAKGALDLIMMSLTRLKIDPSKEINGLGLSNHGWFSSNETSLIDIVNGALGVMENLCELSEGQEYLASCYDRLNHFMLILANRGFSEAVHASVAEILTQVSNNILSHVFLSQREVLEVLLEKSMCDEKSRRNSKFKNLTSYYSMFCISKVILYSPDLLSWLRDARVFYSDILRTLFELLKEPTIKKMMIYEEEAGYCWETVVPDVMIMFVPLYYKDLDMLHLQLLIQRLFAKRLLSLLQKKSITELLLKEGLVNFIVCLHWYSGDHLRKTTQQLTDVIRTSPDVPYQPPSLLNMCKATVAVYHCGLHDVMRLSVPELVSRMMERNS